MLRNPQVGTYLCVLYIVASICKPACSQKKTVSPDAIYASSKPSVVTIFTFDSNKAPLSQGSGFIVSKDRVVTNYHVIEGASSASVIFDDGVAVPTDSLTAASAPRDLVILKVNTGKRPYLKLGNELDAKVGQSVYAIGTPQGLSASLSSGLVSAFREDEGQFLIQITASISPGSSGGPLFDSQGSVIGITTSRLKDGSFGFAIGIGDVLHLLKTPLALPMKLAETHQDSVADATDLAAIQALYDQKKYAEAESSIAKLASPIKDSYEAKLLQCQVSGELRESAALETCEKASRLRQSEAAPHEEETLIYLASRDLGRAEKSAMLASSLTGGADSKQILGLIYYLQGRYDLVAKQIPEKDDDGVVLTLLQGAALRTGDTTRYADLGKKVFAIKGNNNGWQLFSEGIAAQKDLKWDVAISKYKLCEKDSDFVDPACAEALLSAQMTNGDREDARASVESQINRYYNNPGIVSIGQFVYLVDNDIVAAKRLHQLIQSADYPEKDGADCLYYYGINQPSSAIDPCNNNTKAHSNDSKAWSNSGWVALDLGQYSVALTDFSKSYRLYQASSAKHTAIESIDLQWGMLLAAYFTGDKKNSRAIYRDLKKEYPQFATMSQLKQLPLVWSDQSQVLIRRVMADYK